MISDTKFLGFDWPPKMESFKPKQKKQYIHNVLVTSTNDPDYAYVLTFTSEQKARAYKKATEQATNKVLVEYERKEIPVIVKEGFIA